MAVAVVNLEKADRDATLVMMNAKLASESGKKDRKIETCMSVRSVRGGAERRSKVTVIYTDLAGEEREMTATGFLARVVAHEVDHLHGRLYLDHMPPGTEVQAADVFDV